MFSETFDASSKLHQVSKLHLLQCQQCHFEIADILFRRPCILRSILEIHLSQFIRYFLNKIVIFFNYQFFRRKFWWDLLSKREMQYEQIATMQRFSDKSSRLSIIRLSRFAKMQVIKLTCRGMYRNSDARCRLHLWFPTKKAALVELYPT